MKKVQSQFNLTKCLMNSSLSFTGLASFNFLKERFLYLLFGSKMGEVKKSLLSPYFKNQRSSGFLVLHKTKKLEYFSYSSFFSCPVRGRT